MSKNNRFSLMQLDDNSINDRMRAAIERCKKAEAACQGKGELDYHSDFDELEVPVKKPLFSFGEKALSKIADAVRRTPTQH